MKLIITRHGETEENEAGILQGHIPGKLSKQGLKQVELLGKRLAKEKIDYIYSSDLARSADTAKEIARHHKGVDLVFTKKLRERHLGVYQGKKKKDLGLDEKSQVALSVQPEGGEKMQDAYNRAKFFLESIITKNKGKTVLLVAHGGINKLMIAILLGRELEHYDKVESQDNTSYNEFEIREDNNHKLLVSNCTKHLD